MGRFPYQLVVGSWGKSKSLYNHELFVMCCRRWRCLCRIVIIIILATVLIIECPICPQILDQFTCFFSFFLFHIIASPVLLFDQSTTFIFHVDVHWYYGWAHRNNRSLWSDSVIYGLFQLPHSRLFNSKLHMKLDLSDLRFTLHWYRMLSRHLLVAKCQMSSGPDGLFSLRKMNDI